MENIVTNAKRTWFEPSDGAHNATAWLVDDLSVHLGAADTITVVGTAGSRLTLDLRDAQDLAAVLTEAIGILKSRGFALGVPDAITP
jgi:hypothetical protein